MKQFQASSRRLVDQRQPVLVDEMMTQRDDLKICRYLQMCSNVNAFWIQIDIACEGAPLPMGACTREGIPSRSDHP